MSPDMARYGVRQSRTTNDRNEQVAHPVPEVEVAFPVLARLPERRAAVLLHLVHREGAHGERHEDVRQVVFPCMAVVGNRIVPVTPTRLRK